MDITVRLYKLHDYDLIYLYKNLRFPIKDAMKQALENYVRGEPEFFEIPIVNINKDELTHIKNAQFHIKLDEDDDADIIEYLSTLKKFYRNSFLKNLLRGFLVGPAAYVYEENGDIEQTKIRYEGIKEQIFNPIHLKPMKRRKKKKDYVILTESQKDLFDKTGALDDTEIIIKK